MARSGPEILFDSLLKAAGMDPATFKDDLYKTIHAVKSVEAALVSMDQRLARIETALRISVVENIDHEVKQLTNGAANG